MAHGQNAAFKGNRHKLLDGRLTNSHFVERTTYSLRALHRLERQYNRRETRSQYQEWLDELWIDYLESVADTLDDASDAAYDYDKYDSRPDEWEECTCPICMGIDRYDESESWEYE